MEKTVAIAKALSDQNRVRALMALRGGELCVCQIIELLELAPSTVSKHMSVLKQAGLVVGRKNKQWVHYSLMVANSNRVAKDILKWVTKNNENDPTIRADLERLKSITC